MTLNKLQKEVDDAMINKISNMDKEELEETIMTLTKTQYVSYLNDNIKEYNKIQSILDFITNEYGCISEDMSRYYNNIHNFINYCRIVSIHTLLDELFNRNFDLKMPDEVGINTKDYEDEEMKLKRYANYFKKIDKQARVENMKVRPDATIDMINDNMDVLAGIFTANAIDEFKKDIIGGYDL